MHDVKVKSLDDAWRQIAQAREIRKAKNALDETDACGCLCQNCRERLDSESQACLGRKASGSHGKPEEPGWYWVQVHSHFSERRYQVVNVLYSKIRSPDLGFFDEGESKPVFITIHSKCIVKWGPRVPEPDWDEREMDEWITCND